MKKSHRRLPTGVDKQAFLFSRREIPLPYMARLIFGGSSSSSSSQEMKSRFFLQPRRDIKTTNILLDEQLKAKLADLGLSRSFPVGGESYVSTVVAGTRGYLDPEYYRTTRLGEKSDVQLWNCVIGDDHKLTRD